MLKAQPLRTRSVFVSAIALATASLATAQPVPDQVLHHGDGTVSFLDLPGFFQINAPHQSVIQYFSFNVPGGFHVNFNQTMGGNQSPNAAVLNYIPGATPSSIFGQVTGNGIIYMVNPQGFIFGGGAEVSANRFFAAASTLSDPANFFSDPDLFNVFPATPFDPNSDPIPSVINFGSIHANEAVHLLGPLVRNFGQISTGNNGLITMTAHNGTVTLGNGGNFYVHVANGGAGIDDYGVVNTGELTTGTGGTVMLGAGDMYSLAIRLEGSGIQAANLVLGGDGANPGETNTQGDVNLGSDVIIAADNATFHGTIDSTAGDFHGLTINPFSGDGDQVTFNARVGSVDRLGHLNVNSTSININTDQIFTGTGVAVASGDQTYNGNVVLGEDTTIDSNGGSVTFESTVDSEIGLARNLTIDAATIRFNDNVGAKAGGRLGTATLNGGVSVLNAANFNADEWQFNTAVVLETDATVDGTTSVIFGSTLNSDFGGNRDLTVNSLLTRFEGNVGTAPGGRLGTVTTDAAGTTFLAASDLRAQTWQFNDDVVLEADVVLDATAGVTFGALLNSENGMNHGLTVNGGGSAVTFTGAVGGAVNGTLGALAVNTTGHTHFTSTVNAASVTTSAGGTTQLDGSVTTTGGQTYNNDVTTFNGITLTGTTIAFNDILRPGGTNVGTLNIVGNLNLHSLDWQIASNGSFDQIIVSGGNVTLLGGNITGSLINDFLPANQTSFRIINNTDGNAIAGQFAQGGEMFDTTGRLFEINYAAGGNHLDLTKVPRDRIWSGGGADNLWLTALNWLDGFAPDPEDRLIFGMTVRQANFNNFAAGTLFESITFNAGGFTLSGNALNLSHGLFTLAGAGSNAINLNVTTTQAQNWSIADGTTLTLNGALTLGDELTVSRAGTMQFEGTIDGDHALVVNGAGTVRFGNTVTINSLTTSGGFTQLGANVTTTGLQEYDDTVTLTDNVTLESLASVTFGVNSSLNSDAGGNRDLTVNSPLTRFAGNVGTGDDGRLGTVTTDADGTTFLAANQFLAANWLFNDAVVLEADATVDGSTSVVFGSTLDSDFGGNRDLTVNSPLTRFEGNIGTAVGGRLGTVTTDADGTTFLAANQFLAANWLFNDAVVLEADATVDGSTSVVFGSTLDSDAGGNRDLTVNSPETRFAGDVGTGDDGRLGTVTTDADGTTFLAANQFLAANWLFNDAVVLEADATVDGSTSVVFGSTLDSDAGGNRDLTVNSPLTRFEGNVGTGDDGRLGTVTTDADGVTHLAANQFLAANWLFNDAVLLEDHATVDGTASVIFGSTLDSLGGPRNLTVISPLTRFEGNVGTAAGGRLGDVETDADGTTFLAADEFRAMSWLFNDAVIVEQDAIVDGTNSVTFASTVNSSGDGDDISDDNSLTVLSDGEVTFEDAVGGAADGRLGFLDVTGTDINVNGGIVNTNDYQRYDGAVWLGNETEMNAGGYVHFTGTVNSVDNDGGKAGNGSAMHSLTVNSDDDVTFDGAVGNIGILGFLEVFAANDININGGYVNTNEHQLYDGAVKLGADTVMDAGTHVTFTRSVDNAVGNNDDNDDDNGEAGADGRASLIVNSGGMVTFNGAVGGGPNGQLRFLEVNANNIDVNGSFVNTEEHQLYNGATRIGGFMTIMLAGGDVTFTETLDSSGDGASSDRSHLRIQSGGQVTFQKAVGGAADGRFASLDITGDQININGGLMQSFGVQEYHGAVRLGMNTLLHTEAGGILIDGTLDSEAGKQVGLTVTTPGLLTLGGAVGGNDQLSSFQRNGGGATAINGGLVRTVNGQNYGSGAVSIGANADLIAGTTVAFGGTVNSANGTHALAIKRNNGVGGNATFGNSVGQNSPLSNLMVEGATTFGGQQGGNVVSITTTQDQTYGDGLGNNDITLLSHATLNGRTITARGQINGQDHDIAINATDMIDLHDDVDVRRFETGQGGTTHLRNGLALTARQLVKIDNALQLHGHTLVSVTEVSPFMFAVEFRSINGAHDLMVDSHSGGIRFNDRIGGTTALNNLSANAMNGGQILFDTLESANGNPFVMLTGNLMLNTDVGPQQDPTVAKIGATGDLWIQSNGNFVMGRGQKLTAIGSVIIDVANAIIGDISALNNIEINANTITILLRPAAEGFDQGVDFVAGGMILFSVIPDLDGEGPQPQFATPNGLGGASIATLQGFLVRALDYVVGDVQEIQDANTSFVFPDLVATGAASTDLSTALAAEMPDEGGTDEADTETSLAGDDVAILAQRGFIVRILENAELAELVQGRGVYIDGRTEPIDVPGIDGEAPVFLSAGLEIDLANVRPQGIDPAILQRSPVLAKQRVSRGLLDSVVSAIDRLRTVVNPETGEQESRIDLVRPALDSMWRMFTADHPGAPAREFPEYLRRIIENPIDDDELEVASEALNFLRDVADLRDGLHAFGMSRREARMALVEIIRPFLAADVSVSNFFEAIEGLER
jgi:filamentous hemagglutinin family protein